MPMIPFAITSDPPQPPPTLRYGDRVIVGALPAELDPADYTTVQGVAYTEGIGPLNIFGYHCGPGCEACKSIPPCPPHDPPFVPPGMTLPIHIKSPVSVDGQGFVADASVHSRVSAAQSHPGVLEAMQDFATQFHPSPVAFHAYRISSSSVAGLSDKILMVPVATTTG